jgi:hypothetical protein
MKKMIIVDEKHAAQVEEVLKEAQGRARERRIDSTQELIELIDHYTKKIPTIPKKHMENCELVINVGAGKFPNAYKYRPMGTQVVVVFKNGTPRIRLISRIDVNGLKEYSFRLTDIAKASVLKELNVSTATYGDDNTWHS